MDNPSRDELAEMIAKCRAERDEARAEVERLRTELLIRTMWDLEGRSLPRGYDPY